MHHTHEHTLSSYTWVLLCIFHLQSAKVLPVLQQLTSRKGRRTVSRSDGVVFEASFPDTSELQIGPTVAAAVGGGAALINPWQSLGAARSDAQLGELICGFFVRYEREFAHALDTSRRLQAGLAAEKRDLISVRTGGFLPGSLREGSLLPIEDPIETSRDLGGMLNLQTLTEIHAELRDARDQIFRRPPDVVTEGFVKRDWKVDVVDWMCAALD